MTLRKLRKIIKGKPANWHFGFQVKYKQGRDVSYFELSDRRYKITGTFPARKTVLSKPATL